MSCLDVMYHQSYGAHYLPAAAYKATYYNHHHHHQQQQQQQQQKRLSVYSKMQECMEQQQQQQGGGRGMPPRDQGLRQGPTAESGCLSTSDSELKDCPQPAETEYLSSRCVLFTYFQGDIGDVVDEHFSRALSQTSTFDTEAKPMRVSPPSATAGPAGLWKEGGSPSEGQSSSVWNTTTSTTSSYPSQVAGSGLPSVSVSVHHPDFSSSPVPFTHPADGALWADHVLSQAGLPPPASLPDTWTYSLNPQSTSPYSGVHNVYHPHSHPHIHARHPHPHPHPHHHHHHHHPMLHSYPTHDPRFNPLLLAGVRNQNQNQSQTSASAGSSPHSEGVKTEMDPGSNSPVAATSVAWSPSALQGSLEVYDSALDQTKAKSSVWF